MNSMKCLATVLAVSLAALSTAALYAGPARARNRLAPRDFETTRKDGRFENHMAFAREIEASVASPEWQFRPLPPMQ